MTPAVLYGLACVAPHTRTEAYIGFGTTSHVSINCWLASHWWWTLAPHHAPHETASGINPQKPTHGSMGNLPCKTSARFCTRYLDDARLGAICIFLASLACKTPLGLSHTRWDVAFFNTTFQDCFAGRMWPQASHGSPWQTNLSGNVQLFSLLPRSPSHLAR